jgi:hypothetical protein
MQRVILLTLLGSLMTALPSWAQERDSRPPSRRGEITIPSGSTLEREAVTSPKNDFSTNDATAIQQMDRQNREIDRKVMKGICTEC